MIMHQLYVLLVLLLLPVLVESRQQEVFLNEETPNWYYHIRFKYTLLLSNHLPITRKFIITLL